VTVVQEFLDGQLQGVSAEEVREHFEICSRCYPHLKFERSFREALSRASSGECAPPELRRRVVDLLAGVGQERPPGHEGTESG
jgi:anti-sigma factor (TIGR02949 family)